MAVELSPTDLSFRRPFNREVTEVLHLQNNTDFSIAFKVKTTAPKHYCVRPNSGRIEAGKQVEVQVLLQAMKEQPSLDAKCKDKFLVQSVAITGDLSFSNVTSIFENAPKSAVQERKIRVTWLPEETNQEENEDAEYLNRNPPSGEAPPAYSTSPSVSYQSPATVKPSKTNLDSTPIAQPDFGEKDNLETPPDSASNVTGAIRSPVTGDDPGSIEELNAQLAEAYAQIQLLKERQVNQEPRLRKTTEIKVLNENTLMMQQHQGQSTDMGVPLQVVAVLCLLSFLMAYFFF
jgi:hypothetical protein